MKPEEKYVELYHKMAKLCEKNSWGDPFSYARSKEITPLACWGTRCRDQTSFLGLMP